MDLGNITAQSSQHYPTANKFGLLAPADPTKYAGEQAVFWCPKAFANVVRFHVIDPASINRKSKPIQLSFNYSAIPSNLLLMMLI